MNFACKRFAKKMPELELSHAADLSAYPLLNYRFHPKGVP